ncbi:hypothetical protein TYRP_002970 [Tyrophagus putrescentiae]|nr:hypothetical protein TYRP_002970 [Tyrophagus putrescentiae]
MLQLKGATSSQGALMPPPQCLPKQRWQKPLFLAAEFSAAARADGAYDGRQAGASGRQAGTGGRQAGASGPAGVGRRM